MLKSILRIIVHVDNTEDKISRKNERTVELQTSRESSKYGK